MKSPLASFFHDQLLLGSPFDLEITFSQDNAATWARPLSISGSSTVSAVPRPPSIRTLRARTGRQRIGIRRRNRNTATSRWVSGATADKCLLPERESAPVSPTGVTATWNVAPRLPRRTNSEDKEQVILPGPPLRRKSVDRSLTPPSLPRRQRSFCGELPDVFATDGMDSSIDDLAEDIFMKGGPSPFTVSELTMACA